MVGIDIGTCRIKLVHLVGGKLQKTVTAQLPDHMVKNGVIQSMDAMAEFLRITARENGIPRSDAAIVLPEELVLSRNVTLPAMTASQLRFNLPYECRDYLTLDKEQYFFDYAVLGTQGEGTDTQMDVFLCAVEKKTIADYRAMLRRAGFRLKTALPEQWACVSALRHSEVKDLICLADIGCRHSRLHICRDGRPDSYRSIDLGIGAVETDQAALYDRLSVEVRKTVNFYNSSHRQQALGQLCLCGGGAAIEPLRQSIRRVTGLEVKSLQELAPALSGMEAYIMAFGCAVNG